MDNNKSVKYPLLCGKWGTIFSIAVIAIRAFQVNAEPMSSWSVLSWFLMTLPMTIPFATALLVLTVVLPVLVVLKVLLK